MSVSCSELCVLLLIQVLVKGARDSLFSGLQDENLPFDIMCYLQDSVDLPKCQKYSCLSEYLEAISQYVYQGKDLSLECTSRLDEAMNLKNIVSVDSLVDFFDSLNDLFTNDANVEVNSVCAPTRLCADSPLGLFVKTCMVRWECMPFDAVCLFYEKIESFKIEIPGGSSNGYNGDSERALLFEMGRDDQIMDLLNVSSPLSSESPITDIEPSSFLLNAHKASLCGDTRAAEESVHRYFDSGNSLLSASLISGISGSGSRGDDMGGLLGSDVSAALESLKSSVNEPQFAGTRHQHAMLTLATIWAKGGQHELAMRGTCLYRVD